MDPHLDAPDPKLVEEFAQARVRLQRAEGRLQNLSTEISATRETLAAAETKTGLAVAADELSAMPEVSLKREPRGTVISVAPEGLFEPGASRLATGGEARLAPIAEALSQDRDHRILVEDHATIEWAPELLQARADAVREFLASHGVRAELLRAAGVQRQPPGFRGTAQDDPHERRIEIVLER